MTICCALLPSAKYDEIAFVNERHSLCSVKFSFPSKVYFINEMSIPLNLVVIGVNYARFCNLILDQTLGMKAKYFCDEKSYRKYRMSQVLGQVAFMMLFMHLKVLVCSLS